MNMDMGSRFKIPSERLVMSKFGLMNPGSQIKQLDFSNIFGAGMLVAQSNSLQNFPSFKQVLYHQRSESII